MSTKPTTISVTGTKGKTTTVAVVADVLKKLNKNVLKVDTTGHFVNGERRSTLSDSMGSWGLVPSVAPGRYLYEFYLNPDLKDDGVAVLECSLGSSNSAGLGYKYHDIGVFLNVFEDHIGSSARIKSKEDIVRAKDFIFSRIDPRGDGGYAVFNADDPYVMSATSKIHDAQKIIPVGLTFEHFDVDTHLKQGNTAITVEDNHVVVKTGDKNQIVANLNKIPWAFNGKYLPSVWNIISAVGALYAYFSGNLPKDFREAVESVRLDKYGGRLTLLENKEKVTIIADYAHEKVSLSSIAELARTMVKDGGKLIGVVRLAYDRTDDLVRETGDVVGRAYDELVVYDKIDGHWRQPNELLANGRFPQVVGRTSDIFAKAIKKVNPNVSRILREDEALAHATELAQPGDVVVVIVNDNIERSIGFIKERFSAEFI